MGGQTPPREEPSPSQTVVYHLQTPLSSNKKVERSEEPGQEFQVAEIFLPHLNQGHRHQPIRLRAEILSAIIETKKHGADVIGDVRTSMKSKHPFHELGASSCSKYVPNKS